MDPGSSRILLGTAGAGGEDYWINTIGADGVSANGVTVDSLGNVYAAVTAFDSVNSRSEAYILKFGKAGLLLWQREFDADSAFRKVALDSGGNVYAVGESSTRQFIAKYNSSGTLQWQRLLSGGTFEFFFNVIVAPSGNIYAVGDGRSSTFLPYQLIIQKLDSSGTELAFRAIGATSGSIASVATGVALDSAENVYISGRSASSNTSAGYTIKIPSSLSGSVFNAGFPRSATFNGFSIQVATDSSGNSVTLGQTFISTTEYVIVKRNSSGTLLWKKNTTLGGNGNGDLSSPFVAGGIALDSSGNVYVCGTRQTGATATQNALIFKLDSSGSLVWSRTFSTGTRDQSFDIKVDNLGSIYVCGFQSVSGTKGFVTKLPDDGSLTGTYGSYTYASTDIGLVDCTLSDVSPTYSNITYSRPPQASAFSDIAGSLSVSTIAL